MIVVITTVAMHSGHCECMQDCCEFKRFLGYIVKKIEIITDDICTIKNILIVTNAHHFFVACIKCGHHSH